MADKSYLTQCPHCGVKFQISLSQMKMANGAVRCGSCLEVFQANENIVQSNPAPAAAAPTPPPPPPPAQDDSEAWADDILSELEDEPGEPEPEPAAAATPPPAVSAGGNEPKWTPPSAAGQQSQEPQWAPPASSGGADSSEPAWSPPPESGTAPTPPNSTSISLGDTELDDSLFELENKDNSVTTKADQKKPAAIATDLSDELSLEMEPQEGTLGFEEEPEIGLEETPEENAANDLSGDMSDELGMFDDLESDALGAIEELTGGPASQTAKVEEPDEFDFGEMDDEGGLGDEFDFLNDPELNSELGGGTTSTPISLDLDDGEDSVLDIRDMAKWGGLSILAILVLFIQSLSFNFHDNATQGKYIGIYNTACGILGCQIPSQVDIQNIKGANLVVRKHPNFEDALIVDAIVYNKASHEQPFPALELSFSDRNDVLLARRQFQPSEYLTGELKKLKKMPSNTPLHLSLPIVNPGPDAVNYVIQFYAAENS